MPAPPSRSLAAAVHRPLAEQVAAVLAPIGGRHALDVDAGDLELASRLRSSGAVVDVVEAGALRECSDVATLRGGRAYDVAASVLAFANDGGLAARLAVLRRLAPRVAVVVWEDGATHLDAVAAAFREAGADTADTSRSALAATTVPAGWERSVLREVARFDGVTHLLAAVLGDQEPARETETAVRDAVARRLAAHTAADGSLRIPIQAALLRTV